MARKFIPDSDVEFANFARNFAQKMMSDPARYRLSEADAGAIGAAFEAYDAAFRANSARQTRSSATAKRKDEARAQAERLIRRAAHFIRGCSDISAADKVSIRVKDRPARLRRRDCPQTPPVMHFVRGVHGSYSTGGRHIIRFSDNLETRSEAKPEGAVRLELFVDLVPPGEPIPARPGDRHGGMSWYLRSYTRSPIKVEYPRSQRPMRVVYWGRWANATGETGPFCAALAAPFEGSDWSLWELPAPADVAQTVVITSARRELPDRVETVEMLHAQSTRALPEKTAGKIVEAA